MGNIAVIYATGLTKNTKTIAEYIARRLGADIFNLKELSTLNLEGFDTIVFGTGIHAGKPYAPLVKFLENNKETLNEKRLYLFLTCMYNGEKGDKQCAAVSEKLGLSDAVYFNKKSAEKNESGIPTAVDDFIARLQ